MAGASLRLTSDNGRVVRRHQFEQALIGTVGYRDGQGLLVIGIDIATDGRSETRAGEEGRAAPATKAVA